MTPFCTKTALSLLLLTSIVTLSTTLDCSSLYYKETEGVLNYLANVTLTVPYTTNNGWNFYFLFSRNFTGIGVSNNLLLFWLWWHVLKWIMPFYQVWAGTIETNGPEGTAAMRNNSVNGVLPAGSLFSFRFRINWSEQTPSTNPPVLQSFKFGDLEMCS